MNEKVSQDPAIARFLESMASPDPQVRTIAAGFARRKGAIVLPGLAGVASNPDPAIAKGARRAMEQITHYAAQPGFTRERTEVANALLAIAGNASHGRMVRAHALHLLGFVGDNTHRKALTALDNRDLMEDARMAYERMRRAT